MKEVNAPFWLMVVYTKVPFIVSLKMCILKGTGYIYKTSNDNDRSWTWCLNWIIFFHFVLDLIKHIYTHIDQRSNAPVENQAIIEKIFFILEWLESYLIHKIKQQEIMQKIKYIMIKSFNVVNINYIIKAYVFIFS